MINLCPWDARASIALLYFLQPHNNCGNNSGGGGECVRQRQTGRLSVVASWLLLPLRDTNLFSWCASSLEAIEMGISWSNNRRRTYTHYPPQYALPHYPHPPPYYYSTDLHPHPPPPPPPNGQFHHNPPPPALPAYCSHPPVGYASCSFPANPLIGRAHQQQQHHQPYFVNQQGGWPVIRPAVAQPPPPYVEHQSAKKVKNVVNVHKDTVRIRADELNPDQQLVSFVFDALHDGRLVVCLFHS